MPTKTDRILGYLPGTFHPAPSRSALRAVADAFGGELQRGENLLAEVMQAHWVDFADLGGVAAGDLARIGALYGLLPRDDETVEQFRIHLKRYVRTLLDGTVTVRGALRIAAEALGLTIDDVNLDAWWQRSADELVTVEIDRADAAVVVLGVSDVDVSGVAARRAEIAGTPPFGDGLDLRERHILYVVVDDRAPVVVDLTDGAADPARVPLEHVVTRLGAELGAGIARADGDRLVVASPTFGPDSRLEVREGPDDAATDVLGLLPLSYRGSDATAARIAGPGDYAAGVDLSDVRYLRLQVDGTHLAEIDCADPADPAHTFLDHIRDAINAGLGIGDVATHDGHALTLTSPSTGAASRIEIGRAAAQDAARLLFGTETSIRNGQDPQPARYTGTVDLRDGVDLSENSLLRLRVDDIPTVTADCAGAVPEHTHLDEVVVAINAAIGAPVALAVAGRLQLTSPSTGELAELALDPVSGDASPALLGLPPRLAEGAAATVAHVTGTPDLSGGAEVSSRHHLEIAVDGASFVPVDLREGPGLLPLGDLVVRINTALGADVATDDGAHLVLRSRHPGGGSRVQVRPARIEQRRRFVTRAFVTGEAGHALFGFDRALGRGDGETRAVVVGRADLSHGVDLSAASRLRITIDEGPPVEVDCAGGRARATVLDEIVPLLNTQLHRDREPDVASHDGTHLILQSPTAGAASRIAFEVPQEQDARAVLLGDAPTFARGSDATGVTLVGVADLSAGVDLPAHAALRIGVDAAATADVPLTGDDAGHRSLSALASLVNAALGGAVASHDGTHLALTSPTRGATARLVLEPPSAGVDATAAVLGVTTRSYHGSEARRAEITGTADVAGELNLSVTRFLVLSVDGGEPVTVDCAAGAADPAHVNAADVPAAVIAAMRADVASVDASRLVLRSARAGSAGRISVESHVGADARTLLFGPDVPAETDGLPVRAAMITGDVDLLAPADLSARSTLLIAVDGGAPREIDVAGGFPAQTTLDEVVAAIDVVLPGVATPTAERRLQLVSPTTGPDSRVELVPVRSIDVVEFPPAERAEPTRWLRHGDAVTLDNDGAGDSFLTVRIEAPQGNGGPALVNRDASAIVALMRPLSAGDAATIWRDDSGRVRASVESPAGSAAVPVPPTGLRAGRLGAWASVAGPWTGPRVVPGSGLQLANPWAAGVDTVLPRVADLTVEVAPAAVTAAAFDLDRPDDATVTLTATLRLAADGWHLHGAGDVELIAARAGAGVGFAGQDGAVVGVTATFRHGEPAYLLVTAMARRFDVTLRGPVTEPYPDVTIGEPAGPHALADRVMTGAQPSALARVRTGSPGDALLVHRGRSRWQVLECLGSRFDASVFGGDGADDGIAVGRFAGGPCSWPGVFDISTFAMPDEAARSVFAGTILVGPPSGWTLRWARYTPGAFEVNLPADLPARFGGRFDEARFASDPKQPETYPHVVTEPPGDDDNLVALVNARSVLVRAEPAAVLPIGFTAVTLPTRAPQHLTGGFGPRSARIYLREDGAKGFVLLEARLSGEDGNLISVSSRPAGPARFDVTILADGARFESARAIVAGPPATIADRSTLEPAPLGVDQAKAAGTRVRVTRDRSGP